MAQRPRASILSLFDPLSLSPTSDKENICETSLFHSSDPRTSPVRHTLRRRLIDVGDITVDEPDMHDLLAMEDELEEIHNNITDNDDGDTLTWRDMAKAATPKWSGRHATSFGTPKASPNPRTPLAELSFKDDATPMARKKSYRRQIIPTSSKLTLVETPPTSPLTTTFSSPVAEKQAQNLRSPLSAPTIEISDTQFEAEGVPIPVAKDALGSSVCTLDLPSASENLLEESSPRLDMSHSSLQSSDSPNNLLSLPPPQARLRPNAHTQPSPDKRVSMDLQSSFQLHLSSSDATFDLLNEKISFFSSKNGLDIESILNNPELDSSFGEDDLVPLPHFKSDSAEGNEISNIQTPHKPSEMGFNGGDKLNPGVRLMMTPDKHQSKRDSSESHPDSFSNGDMIPLSGPLTTSRRESPALSTPSVPNLMLKHPPRPVPALKIVKRSKLVSRRPSAVESVTSATTSSSSSTSSPSRRTSVVPPPAIVPALRSRLTAPLPSSPADNGHKRVIRSIGPSATKTVASNPIPLSGGGPRRVLVSDGPKLPSVANPRPSGSVDISRATLASGPRRIAANPAVGIVEKTVKPKAAVAPQPNTGLRQPVKYGTLGSTSSIPKPVSKITSRLPAPGSGPGKSSSGVPTSLSSVPGRDLQGRRAT